MSYRTTIGWSLVSSGVVSLILNSLPGDSFWWGILLLAVGIVVLIYRQF